VAFLARDAEVRGWAAGVADAQHGDRRSRRSRKPLGPKPKLWDLQTIPLPCSKSIIENRWSMIEVQLR
jgi:hypothetical protein